MKTAKDGSNRGGARVGAGRKTKPLAEKLLEGNTGHRKPKVTSFDDIPDLEGVDMPEPHEMLSAEQRDGSTFQARAIYEKTWVWLSKRGCAALISPQVLERYSVAAARWIQCEESLNRFGLIGKHPTVGSPIASPFASLSQNYMNQANRLWYEIFQIVKENCSGDLASANPQDDVMERLLKARKG